MFEAFNGAISHYEAMKFDLETRNYYVDVARKLLKKRASQGNATNHEVNFEDDFSEG